MTVRELIERLQTFPLSAEVIYSCYSDYTAMEPEEIVLDEAIAQFGSPLRVRAHASWIPMRPGEEKRQFVIFPGN